MVQPERCQAGASPPHVAPAMSTAEHGRGQLIPAQAARRLRWVAKLLTSIALFAGALYILDWRVVLHNLADVDVRAFSLALTLVVAIFFLMGVRWFFLVREIVPGSFLFHLRRYFTANFMNVFTPANLGGDAYRFLVLRVHAVRASHLVVALVRERLIGIIGYAMLYFALLSWVATVDHADFSGGAMSFLLLA